MDRDALEEGAALLGNPIGDAFQRGSQIRDLDSASRAGGYGPAPKPGIGRILPHTGHGGLQFKTSGRRALHFIGFRSGVRAFEKDEHWLLSTVTDGVTPAEFT